MPSKAAIAATRIYNPIVGKDPGSSSVGLVGNLLTVKSDAVKEMVCSNYLVVIHLEELHIT